MKQKRFRAEQIVVLLRKAEKEGGTVGGVCRTHGISEATYYRWKRLYGGMGVTEVRRLRQLEDENGRLKKLVAERDLEIDALRDLMRKNF